ncbi:PAS domain S-box protein [Sphingomonas sp. KR1UV-12]|uniref:histidine kinase n=1 Tax=Sphingomonas aurea TaxID=3063994 RepID=A0ABT9EJB7_9SPHN|nr:PAS domain S-box protein [Sphingomonas sp. KR1UV-12]MDP1027062.1 PAS domain S-box protein [Sphingomonas sp. KR1UV-12]
MLSNPAHSSSPFPPSGGECAAILRDIDWSTHPLGDPVGWPPELKTAIQTALTSRFPSMVHWGDELFTFYNDGYAAILGRKHPGHLGQPAQAWWSEMWDQLTPFFARVLAGESFYTEDALYTPDRDGTPQAAWFTHSHSPLWNDIGEVCGIFVTAIETTTRVRAELARASDERRNRQVLDSAIDYAIIATDIEGRVTRWNEGARRILGWTEEEMVGETAERFFTPEDVAGDRLQVEMDAAVACGRGNDERWHLRKSGERFWAQGEMTVLRDEHGNHEGYVKVLRDRTEQHLTQMKLEASETRFQLALGAAGFLGSWDWDIAADKVYADPHFAEFYSVPPEQAAEGLPLATFVAGIHPDDRDWVGARIAETVATCGEFAEDYRLQRPDGRVSWVATRGRVFCDDEGKPTHFPGVAVEITERRAMEDALRASEAGTRLALDAADMGIWQTALDLSDQQWDSRTRVLLGHDADEDVGFDSFLDRVHAGDRDRVQAEISAALGCATESLDMQYRVLDRKGGQHWVHVRGRIVGDGGGPARLVGTIRDITPQKAAEEQSALLAKELNHRIKNTLAVVQSIVSQSLRRADTPEQARDAIGERLGALGRAHDLLTQTSWMAAPLRSVVEGATQVDGRATSRVSAEGPEVRLKAKAALAFSMALHELTTNAMKYGALSTEWGAVAVQWRTTVEAGARALEFRWIETGGPPVTVPERSGFGSRLMKGLARDLGGEGQADYQRSGFRWLLNANLEAIEENA